MRQKKLKFVTKEYLEQLGIITNVLKLNISNYRNVVLEVGSGKGKFISDLANDHPLTLFLAFEVNMNVIYRIYEKKKALELDNLLLILGDANNLPLYFDNNSIDKIYLNFSDPWPKAKHHKRRLTYPTFLNKYNDLLKENGTIEFRTDHEDFFYDSIEYFDTKFNNIVINKNLEASKYMSEYEELKRNSGPIMQIKGDKAK